MHYVVDKNGRRVFEGNYGNGMGGPFDSNEKKFDERWCQGHNEEDSAGNPTVVGKVSGDSEKGTLQCCMKIQTGDMTASGQAINIRWTTRKRSNGEKDCYPYKPEHNYAKLPIPNGSNGSPTGRRPLFSPFANASANIALPPTGIGQIDTNGIVSRVLGMSRRK